MNAKLATMIRHGLTAIPALGAYLATLGWLTADEAAQLDLGLAQLFGVVAAVAAAAIGRLVLAAAARWAPGLREVLGGSNGVPPDAGNMVGLLAAGLVGLIAGGAALSLAGCSGGADGNDWRVSGTLGIIPTDGAKAGIRWGDGGVSGFARGTLVDPVTGEAVGTGEIRVDRRSGK